MSELTVFLLILAAVLAFVAWMIWKVLKAPIPPAAPPEPTPLQMEPAFERQLTESPDPLPVVRPAEEAVASPQSARSAAYSDSRSPEPVLTRYPPPAPEREDADPNIAGIAATAAGVVGFAALTGWLVLPVGALARMAGRRRSAANYRVRAGGERPVYKSNLIQGGGKEVPMVNVSVLASGRIIVEGCEITMVQLESRLADLKSRGGKVRYYCEPAEPRPPQAAEVMGLLVNRDIPFTSGGKAGA
jgi:hypothetical protein